MNINLNCRNNQKTSTSIEKDNRNHILAPPDSNYIITNLSHELTLLNYKNYPIRTNDPYQRRCTLYFRSHIDKRLIGAFVTLITFKNKRVTQKQILDRFPHLKKAFVSLVFKHCVEEGWFIAQETDLNPKIHCYQVCGMMIKSATEYYNFCRSSRNELQFIL
jgi:hypothetical protein